MLPREFIHKFCSRSEDEIRYYLHHPCRHDGHLYASNGHILICSVDDETVDATNDEKLFVLSEPIRYGFRKAVLDLSPLVLDLPPAEPCPTCGGSGVTMACPACDGSGEIEQEWFSGEISVTDCAKCHGNGVIRGEGNLICFACEGTRVKHPQLVPVGNAFFSRLYLALLLTLPCLEFSHQPDAPESTAYFRFDGGWGALMPYRGHR